MRTEYRKRIVDEILAFDLECMGAVLIEGPKWCGKTRTGEEQANSIIKLQDPDNVEKYRAAMKAKPTVLLEGPSPRLVDEWQDFPLLWNAVRHLVDERGGVGHFILTGSAVPPSEKKAGFGGPGTRHLPWRVAGVRTCQDAARRIYEGGELR